MIHPASSPEVGMSLLLLQVLDALREVLPERLREETRHQRPEHAHRSEDPVQGPNVGVTLCEVR